MVYTAKRAQAATLAICRWSMTSRHLWIQPRFWQIWNHSRDMMIRWEETGQDNCDAMKEWQSVWQTSKTNRRSYMLSWLPHPTFVPVAIKPTSVIGMEALAFFSDLSCHIWEEPREPLSFHCLLQQISVPVRREMQPKYCGHLLSDVWPNLFDTQHSMCSGTLTIMCD